MDIKYDIALSFAGEDRQYVSKVAFLLKERGVKVFYDEYETDKLWGVNLYDHLSEVYSKRAKYVIMFISKHYAQKVWTNHERKSSQARALIENKEYILPARFDDTEIPGLLHTIGYLDLNILDPMNFVDLVIKKIDIEIKEEKESIKLTFFRTKRELTLAFHPLFFIRSNRNDHAVGIYIDGNNIGDIYGGQSKDVYVSPGAHYIEVRYYYYVVNRGPGGYFSSHTELSNRMLGNQFKKGKTYSYRIKITPDIFAQRWTVHLE
ncbi:toll/interleukin-1 receptor domain-containing protein [Flavilitoribacter nigricans]|uniref:TIR domain-containing protein n=1 Tax=Flavilitoribacter nigricans (strain ATCC 23147 / DSM 23189 / NBRC 102662 / NCIMB 1420 / SS-2) TaxID=1122177 RepID=A0A2D0MWH2_FLAN2|nr:TIR domain-containing protein [Flavilitoribacter nigricans]PHN00585.1 hypothetical protein CRP01_41480 [Flavilitoribacter nigricans DSM 23189 = NBRC 102662]